MKLFNFSFIIGFVALFVMNAQAMSIPLKDFQITRVSDNSTIRLQLSDINFPTEIDIFEILDNDDETEHEVKISAFTQPIVIRFKSKYLPVAKSTYLFPITQRLLLYKSKQSYLQIFRL